MNRQQLLSRLAQRGWPVIYSNGPLDLWERGSMEWANARLTHGVERRDGVWIDRPGKLFATWQRMPSWRDVAMKRHARHLVAAARRHCEAPPIVYIFYPSFERYAASIDAASVIYHAYDDFSQTASWTPALARAERALATRASLVIASASGIAERLHRRFGVNPIVLPNGADVDVFGAARAQPCPGDLAAIPTPRIGYIGRITPKIDLDLIASMAEQRRDWSFVLVGPVLLQGSASAAVEREATLALARCRRQPNVHFLGEKTVADVAGYASHMDVNLMCYRRDPGWWSVGYPLKLHEYLASGQPVVSTDIDAVIEYADVVVLARDRREWVPKIAACLAADGPRARQRRQDVARQNSWDQRASRLDSYLHEALLVGGSRSDSGLPHTRRPMLPRGSGLPTLSSRIAPSILRS